MIITIIKKKRLLQYDFVFDRQASVVAVVATFIAILVVFIELFVDQVCQMEISDNVAYHFDILQIQIFVNPPLFSLQIDDSYVQYPNPTFASFSLGFGAILFAFGGASSFPTIQNDMQDRSMFWKSVVVGFLGEKST